MPEARFAAAALLSLFVASMSLVSNALAAAPESPDAGLARNFTVTLDDKPIGEHRFRIAGPPGQRQVTSEADFVVKLLGIAVYRYHHQATEQWRGDCLVALTASTEENGKRQRVRAASLSARAPEGDEALPLEGCAMSFAYWNPAIRQQTRLLNAQTGRFERVTLEARGERTIEVRGQPVMAAHWRITGTTEPIDLWYGPQGEWIGLDSTVGGGRRLSYRLR